MVKHANLQFRGLFPPRLLGHGKKFPQSDLHRPLAGSHLASERQKRFIIPESLEMAFCTNSRLVVRTPFSVTNDIPPRGESKLIV